MAYAFSIPSRPAVPLHPSACQVYFNESAPRELFMDFGVWNPDGSPAEVFARLAVTRELAVELAAILRMTLERYDQARQGPPPPPPDPLLPPPPRR